MLAEWNPSTFPPRKRKKIYRQVIKTPLDILNLEGL